MFFVREIEIQNTPKDGRYRRVQRLFVEVHPHSWTTPVLDIFMTDTTKMVCLGAFCLSVGWELRHRQITRR